VTSAGSLGRGAHSRRAVLKRAHPHGHVLGMHPPVAPHGARPDDAQAVAPALAVREALAHMVRGEIAWGGLPTQHTTTSRRPARIFWLTRSNVLSTIGDVDAPALNSELIERGGSAGRPDERDDWYPIGYQTPPEV